MKIIFKILKKICLALVLLYSLNIALSNVNAFIPINIWTILIVTILGCPGIICLSVIKYLVL